MRAPGGGLHRGARRGESARAQPARLSPLLASSAVQGGGGRKKEREGLLWEGPPLCPGMAERPYPGGGPGQQARGGNAYTPPPPALRCVCRPTPAATPGAGELEGDPGHWALPHPAGGHPRRGHGEVGGGAGAGAEAGPLDVRAVVCSLSLHARAWLQQRRSIKHGGREEAGRRLQQWSAARLYTQKHKHTHEAGLRIPAARCSLRARPPARPPAGRT